MHYPPGKPDDIEERMTRVALLGTGLLGSAFADGLLSRGGADLTVWNRTRAKAEPLAAQGARVADSPAEAVRGAARVHLVLFDDDTGLGERAVVIDHTTTHPARTAERATRLAREGVHFLHAPVFMSPAAARAAQGMMLVAGDPAMHQLMRDDLERMTGELWYVGERSDLAAAYKLFGNAMLVAMGAGLADIFHMADALDVSRGDALGLFDRFKIEGGIRMRGTRILEENYAPSFQLETARKDVRLMIESAEREPVPVLRAIAARMDDLIAKGFGDQDMAILARKGT
jgi:3-hydroxyisobutyrate dehydrogenase